MQYILTVLLTLAWIILPSTFGIFNVSAQVSHFSLKVVIDAGHGGKDGGCLGAPHNEKDIVLPIALKLGKLIEENLSDVEVIYTRKKDEFITLNKRAKMANDSKADLFISIHANSLPSHASVGGSETYVMGLSEAKANLAVAKRENAAIYLEEDYESNYQGYDPNSNEGHILLSMFQNLHLEKSIEFAQLVETSIKKIAHGKSRGVKQAGFLVLRATNMPSVLIETGYLTNETDNTYLQSKVGQADISLAIFEAFKIYKQRQASSTVLYPIAAASRYSPEATLVKQQNISLEKPKEDIVISSSEKKERTFVEPKPTAAKTAYRVQLAASKNPITKYDEKWDNLTTSIEIREEGEYYKYQTQAVFDLDSAKTLLTKIRGNGFSTAFLVAYRNGKRVKIVQ